MKEYNFWKLIKNKYFLWTIGYVPKRIEKKVFKPLRKQMYKLINIPLVR